MIDIVVIDRHTDEMYIEDNYEYLHATLKGIGDIKVERLGFVKYDESTIEQKFLQEAMVEMLNILNVCDEKNEEKVFKYFYNDIPEIVGNMYIYRQKEDSMKELAKLAGF